MTIAKNPQSGKVHRAGATFTSCGLMLSDHPQFLIGHKYSAREVTCKTCRNTTESSNRTNVGPR